MLKKITPAILGALVSFNAASGGVHIDSGSLNRGDRDAQYIKEFKEKALSKIKMKPGYGVYSSGFLSADIDLAVYFHPIYLEQSYIRSKTDNVNSGVNGAQFMVSRIEKYVDAINETLAQSEVPGKVNLVFVSPLGNSFPVMSSSGESIYTFPDGVTTESYDAGVFNKILEEWFGDTSRYGIPDNSYSRRIQKAAKSDVQMMIRPHLNESMITEGLVTEAIDNYNVQRPLNDFPLGLAYAFGTFSIYDYYWALGSQGSNSLAEFVFDTAAHEFGHVLQADHQRPNNTTSPISYAVASECGSRVTIMNSLTSENTRRAFSSPDIFFSGEPCGVTIGEPDEANNRQVVIDNFPIVSAINTQSVPSSSISISTNNAVVEDGDGGLVNIIRSGDLSESAFVTLGAKDITAREGYIDPITGNGARSVDYNFGLKTVEFEPGQAESAVNFSIPIREHGNLQERFAIEVLYAANTAVSENNAVEIVIESNFMPTEGVIGFAQASANIAEQFPENTALISVVRTGGNDGDATFTISSKDGTAKAGVHYKAFSQNFTFSDLGDTEAQFAITVIDNQAYEEELNFSLQITSETAELSQSEIVINIDERSEPIIGFASVDKAEFDVSTFDEFLTVPIKRINGNDASHPYSLRLAENSQGEIGVDIQIPTAMVFEHREELKSLVVGFENRKEKQLVIELYSEVFGNVTDTFVINVNKPSTLPSASVTTEVTVNETDETITIRATRSTTDEQLIVDISYIDLGATPGIDFEVGPDELMFDVGEKEKEIVLNVINRKDTNGSRQFHMVFDSDFARFTNNTTVITINDIAQDDTDTGQPTTPEYGDKIDDYESGGASGLMFLLFILMMLMLRVNRWSDLGAMKNIKA